MKHEAKSHHPRAMQLKNDTPEISYGRIRRRSARTTLSVPVVVYGRFEKRVFFREKAVTLKVSKHGCLITVNTDIHTGEELVLRRSATGEEQKCRAVYVSPGNRHVGVEFTGELSDFWHIYFPPVTSRAAAPDFVQL